MDNGVAFSVSSMLSSIGIVSRKVLVPLSFAICLARESTGSLMAALRKLRLPKAAGIGTAVVLRFFPTIAGEYRAIRSSQRFRGIGVGVLHTLTHLPTTAEYILIPLILRTTKVAEELSASMTVRGVRFSGETLTARCFLYRPDFGEGRCAVIALNDVSFSYENSREGESQLRHVNLQVAQGELVILAGRSGCGKTTLTRVLNGLCPQFYPGELTGSYLLDGQDALKMPIHQLGTMVGSVFQDPRSQFFTTNTTDEIVLGMENIPLERPVMQQRVKAVCSQMNIERLLDRRIFPLSSGENLPAFQWGDTADCHCFGLRHGA